MHPGQCLKCLLICPRFSSFSYWNFDQVCELVGAKTQTPPLGLLTVAALLPQHWQLRLMDLNTRDFSERDWQWADLVCVGGMYPQQPGILAIVERARREHRFVVVGGVAPTSQPEVYREADALVLGEGEVTIPIWLESWHKGLPKGVFRSDSKSDVTWSPIPRYDLLRFDDYRQIGLQYSRGCPFACEFCDIPELYGRVPRTKTPAQVLAELQSLYRLGYRGHVDIVDDNFIGNKRNVKSMLPALIQWNKARRYPFSFSTEASINLADDRELLEMMRDAGFKYIFTGIETPDPELLRMAHKGQNATRPIVQRIHTIYEYGMGVSAGFIMGFDHEKPGTDEAMIRCIEETGICLAAVNLLTALPNTPLSRRLQQERRMLSSMGELIVSQQEAYRAITRSDGMPDEATVGLNFVPTRSKARILEEFGNVIRTIYEPSKYMNRLMRTAKRLRMQPKYFPGWGLRELWRSLRAFILLSIRMSRNPATCHLYWRNVFLCVTLGFDKLAFVTSHMALYLHFQKQTEILLKVVDYNLAKAVREDSSYAAIKAR